MYAAERWWWWRWRRRRRRRRRRPRGHGNWFIIITITPTHIFYRVIYSQPCAVTSFRRQYHLCRMVSFICCCWSCRFFLSRTIIFAFHARSSACNCFYTAIGVDVVVLGSRIEKVLLKREEKEEAEEKKEKKEKEGKREKRKWELSSRGFIDRNSNSWL